MVQTSSSFNFPGTPNIFSGLVPWISLIPRTKPNLRVVGLDGGRCFPTGGSRIGKGIDHWVPLAAQSRCVFCWTKTFPPSDKPSLGWFVGDETFYQGHKIRSSFTTSWFSKAICFSTELPSAIRMKKNWSMFQLVPFTWQVSRRLAIFLNIQSLTCFSPKTEVLFGLQWCLFWCRFWAHIWSGVSTRYLPKLGVQLEKKRIQRQKKLRIVADVSEQSKAGCGSDW